MSFTVIIPARLASTRLPNKPIADICGKPMIVRVAEQALKSGASRVICAVDDELILNGIEACLTRKDHACGTDRLCEAAEVCKIPDDEIIVNVQGDEPLIPPKVIKNVAELLMNRSDCSMGTAAIRIHSAEEFFNPNVVKVVADKISNDLKGKNPLLLGVLNGSFIFAADLMRMLTIESEISFVKMSSYEGTESTGNVKKLVGLNENIEGRTVVIVEDIVDSGLTMERMLEYLKDFKPAEIRICTLLLKPENLKRKLDIDYVAMEIPNDFIVGYGLDYDGLGRNLRDIYVVK